VPNAAVRENHSVVVERKRTKVLCCPEQVDALVFPVLSWHAIEVAVSSGFGSGKREINRPPLLLEKYVSFRQRRLNDEASGTRLLEHDFSDLPVSIRPMTEPGAIVAFYRGRSVVQEILKGLQFLSQNGDGDLPASESAFVELQRQQIRRIIGCDEFGWMSGMAFVRRR